MKKPYTFTKTSKAEDVLKECDLEMKEEFKTLQKKWFNEEISTKQYFRELDKRFFSSEVRAMEGLSLPEDKILDMSVESAVGKLLQEKFPFQQRAIDTVDTNVPFLG